MPIPLHYVELIAWTLSWPFRRLFIGLDDWANIDDEADRREAHDVS